MFEPARPLQAVCSVQCSRAWIVTQAARKAERKARAAEKREDKARIETPAQAAAKAQAAFNKWVRLRDTGKPCVSCGHPDDGSRQRHASHYKPVGPNPALRYEPWNVHAACSICNNHKSGNLIPYRVELLHRIGEQALAFLEGPHELPRRTVDDHRQVEKVYRRMAREIQKQQEES